MSPGEPGIKILWPDIMGIFTTVCVILTVDGGEEKTNKYE